MNGVTFDLLWVLQLGLAVLFAVTGAVKLVRSREQLAPVMRWVTAWSDAGVHAIGFAEVVGALGLVLPAATGIVPILTPLAALGLSILMVGATVVNVRHGEGSRAPLTAVLALLCAAVAWGRLG